MTFVAIWMGLVVLLVLKMKGKGSESPAPAPGYVEKTVEPKQEDLQLLTQKLQEGARHFQEFMAASDAPSRALHVISPDKALLRMVHYYSAYPAAPYIGAVEIRFQHVIHTFGGPAIETGWVLDDDQQVEAVFFDDRGEWKLDWDAHIRFNTESWALFLSAQGPSEGVFRVLARERIGADGKNDEFIGLVLGIPRLGHPEEIVSSSPEIKVKRASEMGRRIEEAFKAREEGKGAYGSIAVQTDPNEMIRLRVRIVREEGEERSYKITELLGTHWMEIEEPVVKAE